MGLRTELCVQSVQLLGSLALTLADDPLVDARLRVEVLASSVTRGVLLLSRPGSLHPTWLHFFSRLDLRRLSDSLMGLHLLGYLGWPVRLADRSVILLCLLAQDIIWEDVDHYLLAKVDILLRVVRLRLLLRVGDR